MWRSVKALEERNKRLLREREEWIEKALQLSKRLHDLRCADAKMAVNNVARLKERLRSTTPPSNATAQDGQVSPRSVASSGRPALSPRNPDPAQHGPGRGTQSLRVALEHHGTPGA